MISIQMSLYLVNTSDTDMQVFADHAMEGIDPDFSKR